MDSDLSQPADAAALLAEAEAARRRRDHRGGAALARSALDRALAIDDAAGIARARALLARLSIVTGDMESAGRLGRQALEHAAKHGPPALVSDICSTLSFVYDRASLTTLAVQHGLRALESARACGDRAAESLALNRLGSAVRDSEESAGAIGMLEASVQLARTLPEPDATFWPLNNLTSRWIAEADRLRRLGRDPQTALRAARVSADEAEAIARAAGVPFFRAMIGANIAGIHRRLGEYDAARARFVEAIALAHAAGANAQEATFRLALASLEVEAAPSQTACTALDQALDAFPSGIEPDLPLRARRVLAQAWRALGDPERAYAQLELVLADTLASADQRADAQWRLMQTREELVQARHDTEQARAEAELQRVRSEAEARFARELSRHRDHLEVEVAVRTAELQQALVAAEAATRAKSAFLALVGHELRTPLSGVLGMLELAQRRNSDPRQVERLGKALTAARGLAHLVEQLLEFVGDSHHTLPPDRVVDVRQFVGELVAQARPRAHAKGLDIAAEVAPEVPQEVRLDETRARRALETLLDNAVKFSTAGPVTVTVRSQGIAQETAPALVFEVADRGPGIAPELMPRLFRPFEIGDPSYARAHGGLGLGLALVDRWAQAMGARIDVDSGPDRGSTFRLTVPV